MSLNEAFQVWLKKNLIFSTFVLSTASDKNGNTDEPRFIHC